MAWVAMPPAVGGDGVDRFWRAGPERVVIWLGALAALATIIWYVVEKIRSKSAQKEPSASQWLSKYRELHSKGELSDEEFRTIKTNLALQRHRELNDDGEEG